MADVSIDEMRIRQRNRFENFERGEILLPWALKPCVLKILMVVDGIQGSFLNVSFSRSYFGLSAVLDALRENPEYYVRYDVTRAHRQIDDFKPDPSAEPDEFALYGPHFENFRFTQSGFDIDDYDQVWLFGARGDENNGESLQDDELEVLARFMEDGGGVFATGDHDTLGASLCKRIPRVRSMRKWTTAQGVPQPLGADRHDTNLKGHDSFYTFDDESDDIPMVITPRYYRLNSFHAFLERSMPHPVLCGKDGVIDILPDHPHEGEVFDTHQIDLGATFDAGTLSGVPEYPTRNGKQPKPEVIAWAHVQGDHTDTIDTNKFAANAKTFGAIGAYDGHQIDKGRVVVDSTWHHWFDVNLIGRPVARLDSEPVSADNPKTQGFLATPDGQIALSRIYNYFRNVALWCTTQEKQRCLFLRTIWGSIIRYPFTEQLQPTLPILQLGSIAMDAIGRSANQCTRTRWILDWFFPEIEFELQKIPEPCLFCPPVEVLERYVLGGITRALLEETVRLQQKPERSKKVSDTMVSKLIVSGAESGVAELMRGMEGASENAGAMLKQIDRSAKRLPKAKMFVLEEGKKRKRKRR